MSNGIDRLREAKLRVTQPRRQLLEELESADRPLSAEDLLSKMASGSLDLVTIYRNMTVFAEHGIVQVIQLESGKQLFELHAVGDHHHHIICRECHATVRLDLCFGGELEKLAKSQGYSDLNHTIEVFGVCSQCSA